MNARRLPVDSIARGELEIIKNMQAGSASLLALLEAWPDNGKLATVAGAANTLESLHRLLMELSASLTSDAGPVA